MTETKKPQDKKKSKEELEHFEFEYKGETYKFEESLKVLSKPGFIRKVRNKEEIDLIFTILEAIAGDEALAVIDEMEEDEFGDFYKDFDAAMKEYQEASLGES